MDQLPPVGAGNVLRDIIASGLVPVVWLETIFRQAPEGLIVVNAHRINKGQMPLFTRTPRDFFLFQEGDPQKAADLVIDLVERRIPRKFGYDPMTDIQVLSPMHRGAAGVGALNQRSQERLNPASPAKVERWVGGRVFRQGTRCSSAEQLREGDLQRRPGADHGHQPGGRAASGGHGWAGGELRLQRAG